MPVLRIDQQGGADLDDDAPGLVEARLHGRHSSVVTPGSSAVRPPRRDVSITSSSFFIASGTPLVVAPEISDRRLAYTLLEVLELRLDLFGVQQVGLVEGDDLGLLRQLRRIGLELLADHAIGGNRVFAGHVDQMQQHRAALDMAEEARAQAMAFMRAFDQARNVGQHEALRADAHHAQLRVQRGEGIIGDLGLGRRDRREQRRFPGIGQAQQARHRR